MYLNGSAPWRGADPLAGSNRHQRVVTAVLLLFGLLSSNYTGKERGLAAAQQVDIFYESACDDRLVDGS
jgi:hypothetical protein